MTNSDRFILATLLAASLASNTAFAEEWLCRGEKATGFSYVGESWVISKFISTDTYVVRPLTDDQKGTLFADGDSTYGVFVERSENPIVDCKDSFEDLVLSNGMSLGSPGYLYCNNHNIAFNFNRNNLRFMFSLNSGYVNVVPGVNDVTDNTSASPLISIGRCQKQ